jgi:hypothetical protein
MPEPTYRIRRIYSRKVKGSTQASQGTLDAILKFDGDESPHCVYNEIVALRLAQTLHIPVADGALTLTPDGHTYASLELAASGLQLPDVLESRLDAVAQRYPDEVAALVAFDLLIGNFDRGSNLKAVLASPHLSLFRAFDHSHALLSVKNAPEDSIKVLDSNGLIVRFHPFYGRVSASLLNAWSSRIAQTPAVLLRECAVMGKPFRAVTPEMQAALANALIKRAYALSGIIKAHSAIIGAQP